MPELILQFTKRADGRAVLRCVRADGSATWQRQDDERAQFFPRHDLVHYAVETELGFRHGFYGLIAAGWDIADTTGKGARGLLPDEAIAVEYLVSAFSAERASGASATDEEFNQQAKLFAQSREMEPPRWLTPNELSRIRLRIGELLAQWNALSPDATLKLTFPATTPCDRSSS